MTTFYKRIEDSRDKALELIDEGVVDAQQMLEACLQYMSTDDVSDMLYTNEFVEEDVEEEF
jgi:hypothetical protein